MLFFDFNIGILIVKPAVTMRNHIIISLLNRFYNIRVASKCHCNPKNGHWKFALLEFTMNAPKTST